MKILFMTPAFWPEGSGGQLATYLYSKLLNQRGGMELRIVSGSSENNKPTMGKLWGEVPILRVPSETKYSLFLKTPELFLNEKTKGWIEWTDLIYMTGWFPALPIIKRKFGKPVVAHIHSYFPFCPVGSFHNLSEDSPCQPSNPSLLKCSKCAVRDEKLEDGSLLREMGSGFLNSSVGRIYPKFVKMADRIIFVSNAQRDLALRFFPRISQKSEMIHNPIPEHSRIPIKGDDFGYFGGPSLLKGFSTLMKGWGRTSLEKVRNIHATKMDGLSEKRFENIGLLSYSWLDEESFEELYKRIGTVIVPSVYREPLPYIVIESLLRGRVVIASEVGGIPEIVDGLEGVFLVKPGEPKKLSEAIEKASRLKIGEKRRLGKENRREIMKKFNNAETMENFIGTLRQVTYGK